MLGTFAEFEREMIIDRVVAGMERHAAAGRWPGGVHPDGYHLDPDSKRLVVDQDRAVLVREIFDLYTHRRLGTRAIAVELNRRGLRTRTGRPWSAHTIRWLLTNPAYLGHVTFRDTVVPHAHPTIVEQVTFTTAERLLAARGETRTRRAANSSDYHLIGRIRCPHCGKASSAPPPTAAPRPTATTPAGPVPATAPPPARRTGSTPTPPTRPCSPTSRGSTAPSST
jgi:site-specific DNA recombinase